MAKPPFEPPACSPCPHLWSGICPPAKHPSVRTHQTNTTFQLSMHHGFLRPRKCHQLSSSWKGRRVISRVSHCQRSCLLLLSLSCRSLPCTKRCIYIRFAKCMTCFRGVLYEKETVKLSFLRVWVHCINRHPSYFVSSGHKIEIWRLHFWLQVSDAVFLRHLIWGCLSPKNDVDSIPFSIYGTFPVVLP